MLIIVNSTKARQSLCYLCVTPWLFFFHRFKEDTYVSTESGTAEQSGKRGKQTASHTTMCISHDGRCSWPSVNL